MVWCSIKHRDNFIFTFNVKVLATTGVRFPRGAGSSLFVIFHPLRAVCSGHHTFLDVTILYDNIRR